MKFCRDFVTLMKKYTYFKKAWCMSIITKEVITMSPMLQNRHLFASTAFADNIIVCGGQNDTYTSLNSVEMLVFFYS